MVALTTRRRFLLAGVGASSLALLAACSAPASPTAAPTKPAEPQPAKPAEAPKPAAEPTKPAAAAQGAPAAAPTQAAAATKPAGQGAPAAAGQPAGKEKITLRYMERDGALGEFMRRWSRTYEERNPNVTVKNESASWGDLSTKVQTFVAAGTMADVAFQHGALMLPELAAKSVWMDVEPLGNGENHDWKQYYKWALDSLRLGPGNKLVAMPMGVHTGENQLMWNREMLKQAGLKEPDPEMTVDDLTKLGLELKKALPEVWPIMSPLGHWPMEVHARSWKGYLISPERTKVGLDMPETMAAHQYFYDWINTHKIQPGRQQVQGGQTQMFYGQKLAIAINTSPNVFVGFKQAVGDKFTMGDMMWPSRPSGVVGTVPSADANVVYGKTKYPQEAWGLVSLLSGFDCSKWTAVNPPNMTPGAVAKAWNDPDVWKEAPPYKTIALFLNDLDKQNKPVGTLPVPVNTRRAEFDDIYNNEWAAMAYQEKPFDKNAMAELQKRLQAVVDKPAP